MPPPSPAPERMRLHTLNHPFPGLSRSDRSSVRVAAASAASWASFLSATGDERAKCLAAFVRRAVAPRVVDDLLLGGAGEAVRRARDLCSVVDDVRYEPDYGEMEDVAAEDAGEKAVEKGSAQTALPSLPDPTGVFILLDALEGPSALAPRRRLRGERTPSPLHVTTAELSALDTARGGGSAIINTPKRLRGRDGLGADGATCLSQRFGDFVCELREECEVVRDAYARPGTAMRSVAKSKANVPPRREEASAANVVEDLARLEEKARGGSYEGRSEELIAEVSIVIGNQNGTFGDVVDGIGDKASALKVMVEEWRKKEEAVNRVKEISLGLLGANGLGVGGVNEDDGERDDAEEMEDVETAVDSEKGKARVCASVKTGGGNGTDGVVSMDIVTGGGGGGRKMMDRGPDESVWKVDTSNTRPIGLDATGVEAEAGKADLVTKYGAETGNSAPGVERDEREVGDLSILERLLPFPLVTATHVSAARRFDFLATVASSAGTVAGAEAAWGYLHRNVEDDGSDHDRAVLGSIMSEFASLANDCPSRSIPRLGPLDLSTPLEPQSGGETIDLGKVEANPKATTDKSNGESKAEESSNGNSSTKSQNRDVISLNVEGMERIRDLRRQIFAILDQKSRKSGPAGNQAQVTNMRKPPLAQSKRDQQKAASAFNGASTSGGKVVGVIDGAPKVSRLPLAIAPARGGFALPSPDLLVSDTKRRRRTLRAISSKADSELLICNEPPPLASRSQGSRAADQMPPNSPTGEQCVRAAGKNNISNAKLQWNRTCSATSLMLAHSGCVEASDSVITILAELAGQFIERIGQKLASCRERRTMADYDLVQRKATHRSKVPRPGHTIDQELGFAPRIGKFVRSREETLEIVRLVCASGFRGAYPELKHYIHVDVVRVSVEVREAEAKVRNKLTQFAALSGNPLPVGTAIKAGNLGIANPMSKVACVKPDPDRAVVSSPETKTESDPPVAKTEDTLMPSLTKAVLPEAIDVSTMQLNAALKSNVQNNLAASTGNRGAEQLDSDVFPLGDACRMFGLLTPSVRLDVLDGILVPRCLAGPEPDAIDSLGSTRVLSCGESLVVVEDGLGRTTATEDVAMKL